MELPSRVQESSWPDLSIANDLILHGSKLSQCEWPSAVQFLCTDTHFCTKAELAAIRKTRGRVPINHRRIHIAEESLRSSFIGRDDAIGMPRRVQVDVFNGGIHVRH